MENKTGKEKGQTGKGRKEKADGYGRTEVLDFMKGRGAQDMKGRYRSLVSDFMAMNGIRAVESSSGRYFGRMESDGEALRVYKHGMGDGFLDNLYFDYTLDYAACLEGMERDMFLQQRGCVTSDYTFTAAGSQDSRHSQHSAVKGQH